MFFLKKFISWFLLPIPLILEFFIIGWLLHRYSRFKKTGTILKIFSLLLFLSFGYGIGDGYLYSLERRYPPFDLTPEKCEQLEGGVVVVLGQGLKANSGLPIRHCESRAFMLRLLEGMRVAKCIPDSHLIVSMAGGATEGEKWAFLDDFAEFLAFPTNRISMVTTARDTREEVALASEVIRNRVTDTGQTLPVTIVATSASHIPRSLLIFQKAGLNPIAAPCDYQMHEKKEWLSKSRVKLLDGGRLMNIQGALHEGVGLIYETLFYRGEKLKPDKRGE